MRLTSWERAERKTEARAMYRDGCPIASIAAHVEMSEHQVHRWCKDIKNRNPPFVPDERIVELGRRGLSIETIRVMCQAHRTRVSRLLKKAGVPIRKPGQQHFDRPNEPLRFGARAC